MAAQIAKVVPGGFNEAAATTAAEEVLRDYNGRSTMTLFNEAAAIMPRKTMRIARCTRNVASRCFNEAAARMPRMIIDTTGKLLVVTAASMRPRQ